MDLVVGRHVVEAEGVEAVHVLVAAPDDRGEAVARTMAFYDIFMLLLLPKNARRPRTPTVLGVSTVRS